MLNTLAKIISLNKVSFVSGFDRFGSLISLTFEDNSEFKTAFGGFLSYFCIIGYLMYNLIDVWIKSFSMTSTSKVLVTQYNVSTSISKSGGI